MAIRHFIIKWTIQFHLRQLRTFISPTAAITMASHILGDATLINIKATIT